MNVDSNVDEQWPSRPTSDLPGRSSSRTEVFTDSFSFTSPTLPPPSIQPSVSSCNAGRRTEIGKCGDYLIDILHNVLPACILDLIHRLVVLKFLINMKVKPFCSSPTNPHCSEPMSILCSVYVDETPPRHGNDLC